MVSPIERQNLAEPVSLRSRLVRSPGTLYTEVAGSAVAWEPSARALHELSPAVAALWATLDGRPLGVLLGDAPDERRRDAVEALRRLRVLGLVEDVRSEGPTPTGQLEQGDMTDSVAVFGRLVPSDGGVTILLRALAPAIDASGNDVLLLIDVRDGLVRTGAPEGSPTHVISRFSVVDPAAITTERLAPVALLDHLVRAASVETTDVLPLDALADLVERHTIAATVGPEPDALRA